jgi:hypothetical protein
MRSRGRADQIDAAIPGDEGQQAGKESRIDAPR